MRLALVMVLAALAVSKTHAADLEVTVSTFDVVLHRALKALKKALAKQEAAA